MILIDEKVEFATALYEGIDPLEDAKLEWFRRGYLDGATDVAIGNVVVEKRDDGLFLRSLEEIIESSGQIKSEGVG